MSSTRRDATVSRTRLLLASVSSGLRLLCGLVSGRITTCPASITTLLAALAITSASRRRPMASVSSKAPAFGEKTSSKPITLSEQTTGAAIMERIPRARQLSRSTSGWVSESSQRCTLAVRTHSPETPDPTCKRAPNGGASPEEARHTISLPCSRAMADPEARVMVCAR